MKLLTIIFFTAALFFFSCENKKNPIAPPGESLDTLHNPIHFSVGQKWHYRRTMITHYENACSPRYFPDTMHAYLNFSATKDTIIGSDSVIVIEGTEYDIDNYFDIQEFHERIAIKSGNDSIKVIAFNIGSFLPFPLMKSNAGSTGAIKNTRITAFSLRRQLLSQLAAGQPYDTAIYMDMYYPLVFPLVKNQPWQYRPEGDPHGNLGLQRTYLGQEKIDVPGGNFAAYKLTWTAYWLNPDQLSPITWIGEIGTVRSQYEFKNIPMTDAKGVETGGNMSCVDKMEYCGAYNISPDTLVARFGITAAAKAYADQHFCIGRYFAYSQFVQSADSYLLLWTGEYNLLSDSLLSEYYRTQSNSYYSMITDDNACVQGWDDAIPDMVSATPDSFHYIKNQYFGTNYDYRFRGMAIDSIVSDSARNPVDTLWMFYDDACATRPLMFGKSDHQREMRRLIYGK